MPNEKLSILSEKALSLPLSPGVYIMKNKASKVIYVGKAKALKNRVSQYFRPAGHENTKVQSMVDNVSDFDYIICTSESEAFILEMTLIKQYQPKYNILLKDDKGYHYIRVSAKPWRRLTEAKKIEKDGAKYIGPYNSGYIVKKTVEEALKIFRLPNCTRSFEGGHRSRPCLNYSIGLCCAPCAGKIKLNDYEDLVDDALDFINGGSKNIISDLKAKMEKASYNLEFELAARLRDRISALQKVGERQHIYNVGVKEQDVFGVAHSTDSACYEVFNFKNGQLYDRESFILPAFEDSPSRLAEFIMQYYSLGRNIPKQITTEYLPDDSETIINYLKEKSGHTVDFHIPQKGTQLELLNMCKKNAEDSLIMQKGYGKRKLAVLDELGTLIGMNKTPEYIESYDISHTAGQENVAGMVVFKDGKPYKKAYKRFKIKGFSGQDDYASMAEVFERRLNEYENAEKEEGFGRLPDLILLDGGKGQLSAVLSVLNQRGYGDIPIFGMVKDSHHKTRALVGIDGEIQIKQTRSVFTLVSNIQDEVHRFSVEYHRKRITDKMLSMELTSIPGIGKTRAAMLLQHFGTIENIRNASLEQLQSVQGITEDSAKNVFIFFNNNP